MIRKSTVDAMFSSNLPTVQAGTRLSEQLADALITEIRSGRVPAGQKLPTEAALGERFKVSRTVVREALSRMKSVGLLESRQGSGVYVREGPNFAPLQFDPRYTHSLQAVTQMVEVRRALEAEAAELAASRRSATDVKRIQSAITALETAVRKGGDGVAQDVAFHRAIAQASGNPFIMATLEYLAQYLIEATRVTRANEARRGDFAEQVRQEHAEIVAAIDARDPARARLAAAGHMLNAIRRIGAADASFWTEEGATLASGLLASVRR
ncbi:MAG: FadR/GntR family transcriptional regulator [Burkholderiaceae bacterium]|nr:FadR/GntR family transcriptional regulator [Burkholderiaceae bacterium]